MANLEKYRCARLVKGSKTWYIVYYQTHPQTGKFNVHKETHNINRIKSKKERLKKANQLINKINSELPFGYPFNQIEATSTLTLKLTPVLDAVNKALELKLAELNRWSSQKGYKGKVNFFKHYIEQKNLSHLKIGEWNAVFTNDFLNYLSLNKKPSPTTYNDYVRQLKAIFDILLAQFYIKENFFDGIKKRKEIPVKIRKRFDDKTLDAYIEEVRKANDTWFMLSIVLQYYFFFRPIEITRMKVSNVDFNNWTVRLDRKDHKTYKERVLKIPDVAKQYFPAELKELNQSWFLIGSGIVPSKTKCNKNGLYRRFKRYLKKIEQKGFDVEGLTNYSFKNTGGYNMLNKNTKISVFDVQDRMGHSDIKTTKRYVTANDKNAEHIKNEL